MRRLAATAGSSLYPCIFADSLGRVHLTWQDDTEGNYEIYYKRSMDRGAAWDKLNKRFTVNSGDSVLPSISADSSGNAHLVWQDNTPGDDQIFYKRSLKGGLLWSGAKQLTTTSGDSAYPAIAADALGNPHIVWSYDASMIPDVYHIESADLQDIMKSIHKSCVEHGKDGTFINYVRGANVAGFLKVANAMIAQGVAW